ncbi:Uncharacterised protein [Mycobacteroides abscessus subsp. abscessus]|nr:Uncharacterised protein [Mycobacteroides abscessus subsp. abscessus]
MSANSFSEFTSSGSSLGLGIGCSPRCLAHTAWTVLAICSSKSSIEGFPSRRPTAKRMCSAVIFMPRPGWSTGIEELGRPMISLPAGGRI